MAFQAEPGETALARLLEVAQNWQRPACIRLGPRDPYSTIFVKKGSVTWARVNDSTGLTIGDVCCQLGMTTVAQVQEAFEHQLQDIFADFPIGHYLVTDGYISDADVRAAATVQTAENVIRLLQRGPEEIEVNWERESPVTGVQVPIPAILRDWERRPQSYPAEPWTWIGRGSSFPNGQSRLFELLEVAPRTVRQLANQGAFPERALLEQIESLFANRVLMIPPGTPPTENKPALIRASDLLEIIDSHRAQLADLMNQRRPHAGRIIDLLESLFNALYNYYQSHRTLDILPANLLVIALPTLREAGRTLDALGWPIPPDHRRSRLGLLRLNSQGTIDLQVARQAFRTLNVATDRQHFWETIAFALLALTSIVFRSISKQMDDPIARSRVFSALQSFGSDFSNLRLRTDLVF